MIKNHYNTTLEPISLRVYGRIIQNFIKKLNQIKEKEKRNQFAKVIIKLMKEMQPFSKKNRGIEEQVLWADLLKMNQEGLDIDLPFPLPKKKEIGFIKKKVTYPHHNRIKGVMDKSYGVYVQQFALCIKELKEEKKRELLSEALVKLMVTLQRKPQNRQHILNYVERLTKSKERFVAGKHDKT